MRLRVMLAVAIGAIAISGCSGSATTGPSATAPRQPDPACVAARKAERDLQTHQETDQTDESAIDADFMNFSDALSAAAQHEANPATAKAMTALANDYSALVQSQSGAAPLPDMNTVSSDGAAFDRSCS